MKSKFLVFVLIAALFFAPLSNATFAQFANSTFDEIKYRAMTANSGFETGLTDWNWNYDGKLVPTVLTRNWAPPASDSVLGHLGQKLVQLRGAGGWGRYFVLPENAFFKNFVVGFQGIRQRVDGSANPLSNAVAAISYYDANWVELEKFSTQITVGSGGIPGRIGDGIYFGRNIEANVPAGAVYALMFIWNDNADTEVLIDNFGLWEVTHPGSTLTNRNFVKNFDFRLRNNSYTEVISGRGKLVRSGFRYPLVTSEYDFWKRDFRPGVREQVISQSIDLDREFIMPFESLTFEIQLTRHAPFTFGGPPAPPPPPKSAGVTFFDSDWNFIGESMANIPGQYGTFNLSANTTVPENASFAVVWAESIVLSSDPRGGGDRITSISLARTPVEKVGPSSEGVINWSFINTPSNLLVGSITITDDFALETASIAASDFTIVSPSGVRLPIVLSSVGGTPRSQSYSFSANVPFGEPGDYVLRLKSSSVFDKSGKAAPPKVLGRIPY